MTETVLAVVKHAALPNRKKENCLCRYVKNTEQQISTFKMTGLGSHLKTTARLMFSSTNLAERIQYSRGKKKYWRKLSGAPGSWSAPLAWG